MKKKKIKLNIMPIGLEIPKNIQLEIEDIEQEERKEPEKCQIK